MLLKAKAGLVAIKKKTSNGSMITFWVRPEKAQEWIDQGIGTLVDNPTIKEKPTKSSRIGAEAKGNSFLEQLRQNDPKEEKNKIFFDSLVNIAKGLKEIPFEIIEHGRNKYSKNDWLATLYYDKKIGTSTRELRIKLTYNEIKNTIILFVSDTVGKNLGVDIPVEDTDTIIKAIKNIDNYKKMISWISKGQIK